MKKAVTINIPEPCHEGWQNMSPTEKGRFCNSCEKEVIDFSNKNDEDVVKELAGKTNVCGRFKKTQLDRELTLERKSGINLLPYAASLLVPISLMGSEINPDISYDKKYISLGIGRYSSFSSERCQVITSGKITDANGKPLFNVEIIVKESGKSEVSGMRGDYEIKSLDHETLIFRKDGFTTQEVKLQSSSGVRNITLHPNAIENVEIIVMGGLRPLEVLVTPPPADNQKTPIVVCDPNPGDTEVVEGEIEIEDQAISEEKKDSTATVLLRGKVIDEFNLPLPFANVVIKGTDHGVTTNFDGDYEIEADPKATLIFSYLGFETREVNVNVLMKNHNTVLLDAAALGEVVVVGLIAAPESNAPSVKPFSDIEFKHDPEREAWKRKLKIAHANEIEFKRIKQARKRAARKLKRSRRKKK